MHLLVKAITKCGCGTCNPDGKLFSSGVQSNRKTLKWCTAVKTVRPEQAYNSAEV